MPGIDPDRADGDTSATGGSSVVGPTLMAIAIIGVLLMEFCGMVGESAELAMI